MRTAKKVGTLFASKSVIFRGLFKHNNDQKRVKINNLKEKIRT